jgi:hypothetical protein
MNGWLEGECAAGRDGFREKAVDGTRDPVDDVRKHECARGTVLRICHGEWLLALCRDTPLPPGGLPRKKKIWTMPGFPPHSACYWKGEMSILELGVFAVEGIVRYMVFKWRCKDTFGMELLSTLPLASPESMSR